MEISGLFGIGGFIVDLFAFPAADDQPGRFQLPEMMGDRRAAHIRYSRKIDNALLAVTQQPKNTEPASVTQLLEKISHGLKVLQAGHVLQVLLDDLSVVMG